MLAAQGIATGDIDVAVAGGMESMSNCPYLLPARPRRAADGQRRARRLDDRRTACGARSSSATWATPARWSPSTITSVAQAQDAFAAAQPPEGGGRDAAGRFHATRSCPISIPQRSGSAARRRSRTNRSAPDTTVESLGALKPAFKKDGTVTAGNAPGVNDGAAALVVMAPSGREALELRAARAHRRPGDERARAEVRADDAGRSGATRRRRRSAGRSSDVDLFELNEAFSVQAVAVLRELGIDERKVNVNGGAVALGHAIGSSGARVLTTLLYAMKQRDSEARHRHAVPRRRQRRRARGRTSLERRHEDTKSTKVFVLESCSCSS